MDRPRHGDHVGQELQHVEVFHQVVFVGALVDEVPDDVGLAGGPERVLAHRHAPVGHDHRRVARDPEQDHRHPRQPDVEDPEGQQQRVREREHARACDEVAAAPALGQRQELDPEPREGEPPPPQVQLLEVGQPAAEEVAEDDGEREDDEVEAHA